MTDEYETEDQYCPVCKSDSYLNPNKQLYMSTCYHKLCVTCLAHIFQSGYANCPECGQKLSRQSYEKQFFEDMKVEKECRIRRMLNKVMDRNEQDFDNINDYNDYLEEYENYVVNLMDAGDIAIEIEAIKKKYASIPKKVVVDKELEIKKPKVGIKFYDWFADEKIEDFAFNNEIVRVKCFAHNNYAGGLKKYDIAIKAIKSIDNLFI